MEGRKTNTKAQHYDLHCVVCEMGDFDELVILPQ